MHVKSFMCYIYDNVTRNGMITHIFSSLVRWLASTMMTASPRTGSRYIPYHLNTLRSLIFNLRFIGRTLSILYVLIYVVIPSNVVICYRSYIKMFMRRKWSCVCSISSLVTRVIVFFFFFQNLMRIWTNKPSAIEIVSYHERFNR